MRTLILHYFRVAVVSFVILVAVIACNDSPQQVRLKQPWFDHNTLSRMRETKLMNLSEVLGSKLTSSQQDEWFIANPYLPYTRLQTSTCQKDMSCKFAMEVMNKHDPLFPAAPQVFEWWKNRRLTDHEAAVCGLRFDDNQKISYHLKTFHNRADLQKAGFILTHYQGCGTCSSLQDLAVYGEKDLTQMAKFCSKKITLNQKKNCMESIGFTPACAQSWSYNAQHTAQHCAWICLKEYGLLPIILGTEKKTNNHLDGSLNACLLCDERLSGPGFQFSAGRTRRNSGIQSEILRLESEVYVVEHNYFAK